MEYHHLVLKNSLLCLFKRLFFFGGGMSVLRDRLKGEFPVETLTVAVLAGKLCLSSSFPC